MYLFELWFSLGICPGVGLMDHKVALFLVFGGTSILFFMMTAPTYIPTNSVGGFPLLHILQFVLFVNFLMMVILTSVR